MAKQRALVGIPYTEDGVAHAKSVIDQTIRPIPFLDKVKNFIFNPLVGLELPEDYRQRVKEGLEIRYFRDILAHLDERRILPIFLQDPKLYEEETALTIAKEVLEQRYGKFWGVLRYLERKKSNPYLPPELEHRVARELQRHERAREILEEPEITSEGLTALLEETNCKQEEHMLDRITSGGPLPRVVVVGTAHADHLEDELRSLGYLRS